MTCNTCEANKVCDHNKYGFENCDNHIPPDSMDKFEAVDKFRDELMDKFLELCGYNDYNKINLLLIGETVDRIYDKLISDMVKEDEEK